MSRLTKEKVESLREKYPEGCRVRCIRMIPDCKELKVRNGEMGTVQQVYENGLVNVYWDESGTIPIVPGIDKIEKVDMIRVIRKDPGEEPFLDVIENDLYKMQEIVGGYIEVVRLADNCYILCDEDGLEHNAEPNCKICGVQFCGPVIIAGDAGVEFGDVPEDAMELIFGKEKANDRT